MIFHLKMMAPCKFSGNAQSENVIFTILDYENEFDEVARDTLFFEENKKRLYQYKPNGNIITTSVIQSGLDGIDSISLGHLIIQCLNYLILY